MSSKHQKWILLLWGISLSLLYLLWHTHMQALLQQNPRKKNTDTVGNVHSEHAPQRQTSKTETLADFQKTDFYRTIIDNNLFRPLGWTPPRPKEPYRLLGTILPRSENTPPKAIIESTAGNKTYIVTLGEPLDASTEVVDIQPKQVVLSTNGEQRTLKLPSGLGF